MKLVKVKIENFQKCKELEFNLNDGITSIIGANGTGKTTILDAVKWVLFGKDFEDKSRFDINNILPDGTIDKSLVSVLICIEQDGISHELRRVLRGSTVICSVDGVPYKVTDFSEYVGRLTDGEERFKLYSDPLYFFGLHWTAQRSSLMGYFPMPNNELVLEGKTVGKEFSTAIKKLTPEQIILSAKENLKDITERQNKLTGKIEFINQQISEAVGDTVALGLERKEIFGRILTFDEAIRVSAKDKMLRNDSAELERVLKTELESIISAEDVRRRNNHALVTSQISELVLRKDVLREKLKNIYRSDLSCPTCKRPYSVEYQQKMDEALDVEKASIKTESLDIDEKLKRLEETLSNILTMDSYFTDSEKDRMAGIQKKREAIVLVEIETNEPTLSELITERNSISDRINTINQLLSRSDYLEENKSNLAIFKEQLKSENIARETYAVLSMEAKDFITARTRIVVDRLNASFKTIRIKLFDTLASGEQKECFEITRSGVPFDSLNTGSKLEVGLELISFLKEGMGVESPVLIDNGERYTDVDFKAIKGQVIIATAVKNSRLLII